ncbi:MAG: DUF302 domain-containing protein [bacterium]
MNRLNLRFLLAVFLLIFASGVHSGGLQMIRTSVGFEAAMVVLQESVEAHGYTVAHIQKCDGGMAEFDYKTDFYRVVFFGKLDEVRSISEKHPEMIPFLPLKIALFAEGNETVVVSIDPVAFSDFFPDDELQIQFQRWSSDIRSILGDIRDSDLELAVKIEPTPEQIQAESKNIETP